MWYHYLGEDIEIVLSGFGFYDLIYYPSLTWLTVLYTKPV